ncbi:MAG: hypothetical protein JL50_19785 [Peptococcaceae bacterium BICA1-7]|nr:MAG: hypothetical protein JL50_19785 [Peptococcaceae bacterium BICA1-7]HBV98319.1 ABC transporter substrate-binding protein [Desulfotomaculum sp.]
MRNRLYTAALLLLALIMAVAGCSKKPPASDTNTGAGVIRVQAPLAPPSIPLVSMLGDSAVQVIWYSKADEAMSRIIEDSVDVSIIPVNSMSVLHNRGVNIQLGAVSTWGILYLVSGDPQVKGWADLKGKTVAVGAMGYSPDLIFRGLLKKNGLSERDVKIIYGTSPEIAQMIIAKKISLAVLPEPLLTSVLSRSKEYGIVMNLEEEWLKAYPEARGLPQAGLAVSARFAGDNPSAWREFYDKYNNSLLSYVNNPEKIGAAEEKALSLPAEVIRESLGRSNLKLQTAREAREAVDGYLGQLLLIDPEAVGGTVPDRESSFYLK